MGFVSSHLKLHTDAEFNVQWSEIARALNGVRFSLSFGGGSSVDEDYDDDDDDGDDEAKCY